MTLTPGFAVLHGNRLEVLREALVQWMATHPLAPLEEEQILVQSNGIAQWLKMALASTADGHPGIAAGLRVELPNQFVWRLYRMALGADIPASLPYDKNNLTWRILRLLPALTDSVYEPLQRYLSDDQDGRKAWHLAARLADLFDQYQVYRADWLQQWTDGNDVLLRQQQGDQIEVPLDQTWQPALWRALRTDLEEALHAASYSSRADVHQRALRALQTQDFPAHSFPQRVIVFGVSSLPQQTLELLAALGKHSQVLLAVLNPCRHFWGDIATVRDEVRRQQKRQQRKAGLPEALSAENLHLYAPPLLASLGKQGRDYISLLDQFDEPERYRDWFADRIDIYSEPHSASASSPDAVTVLQQLQDDILELHPLPDTPRLLKEQDNSLTFHRCHSRQREVEVLQDQLLNDFAANPDLKPRDVIVMTPDIGEYAPHIMAVFGRIERDDRRYIPFSLADQASRGRVPLLIALEYLLSLPDQRITLNDVFDLLEVPAIQRRFGLEPSVLPQLRLWLTESGVRWGLDKSHRETLGLGAMGDSYSWIFGIERMLLGYALGDSELDAEHPGNAEQQKELSHWQERRPYSEVAGLAATDLGPVLRLLHALKVWIQALGTAPTRSVTEWTHLFYGRQSDQDDIRQNLLEQFFDFRDDQDERLLVTLTEALERTLDAADAGAFAGEVSLAVMRDAWLGEAEQAGLSQRFMGGQVTFSTLLPMRAIPFQRIYMLGLNDGDYPRSRRPDDFDLMATEYRPGDRSRRDDDRYLFLEALLSARESLYLSYVGWSDRDRSEKPASVLVNQVRDYIAQSWVTEKGASALDVLTHDYPLQPFSAAYFDPESTHRTYAREWQSLAAEGPGERSLPPLAEMPECTLNDLIRFMRDPVRYFVGTRLQSRFFDSELTLNDDEPFQLDGLTRYQLTQQLLNDALKHGPDYDIQQRIRLFRAEGVLPVALFGKHAEREISRIVEVVKARVFGDAQHWQASGEPLSINLSLSSPAPSVQSEPLMLSGHIDALFQNEANEQALVLARPTAVSDKGQPRWENLMDAWIQQLAANAAGHPVRIWQFGLDTHVSIPPWPQEEAHAQLQALVALWWQGLQQPLPIARKTSILALLGGTDSSLETSYEGGFTRTGEVQKSAELARYYPTLESLMHADFMAWSERLYGPLVRTACEVGGQESRQGASE
ncbi:exodeoxyribonuclease V subunit gamma [Aliidiomarina halalkaliphila]|uniref:RecBCD enzyme subunit RecC n=1 Tax=Aliidiomarina halalkaliphila TaxID=2593535 RepID=A0A552X049_9GAMM|nr:exodeoxyribonuclease V subunit gamma [Aliidiomarina halalkaliphila]TRW48437.1 exodeoxyribonuclease V subunit gamma [Aliidiomarina halalkaliphila]